MSQNIVPEQDFYVEVTRLELATSTLRTYFRKPLTWDFAT